MSLLSRWFPRAARPSQPAAPAVMDFVCNVCGGQNPGAVVAEVRNREFPSCRHCHGSVRMRSIVRALSIALYGRSIALPDFPVDRSIRGLGISDWEGYAATLAQKFDYTNTFYDRDPKLDITELPSSEVGKYRFVVCSEVFEHVPLKSLDSGFRNLRRSLSGSGACVFTVPWLQVPATIEHFPDLHRFEIRVEEGRQVLVNETERGESQRFEDLVFHGGTGMTLEMRTFCLEDILQRFKAAGFRDVQVMADTEPRFGIEWEIQWAFPILAFA